MFDLHDNKILKYEVNLEDRKIILYTIDEELKTVSIVMFDEVFAHFFETQLQGSIILDLGEYDMEYFLKKNKELFLSKKSECWPMYYKKFDDLVEFMNREKYKNYIIFSSYGLSGWILAKDAHILKENANLEKQKKDSGNNEKKDV